MEIEQYRTIEANLDLANDYVPTIRLNAGDVNGRILRFNVTDGGGDVDDLNGLSARLTWNPDPTDPSSAGGYRNMTARTNTDNATGVRQVTFTTPVPRALLQQAGERTVLGLDIEDAYSTTIASRSIPVIIEPSRLNPKAAGVADPLKDMHDTLAKAEELVDTADLAIGTVSTLTPVKKATGSLTGEGWKRKLSLGIPRGSKITAITATPGETPNDAAATYSTDKNGDQQISLTLPRGRSVAEIRMTMLDPDATPTSHSEPNADGDLIVNLGIPRGLQGKPGLGGDPATVERAGIVKPGQGLTVTQDGTLNAKTYTFATGLEESGGRVSLRQAAARQLGGIRVGNGLTIDEAAQLSVGPRINKIRINPAGSPPTASSWKTPIILATSIMDNVGTGEPFCAAIFYWEEATCDINAVEITGSGDFAMSISIANVRLLKVGDGTPQRLRVYGGNFSPPSDGESIMELHDDSKYKAIGSIQQSTVYALLLERSTTT